MNKILVVDYGSQYSHLLARRVRDIGVYTEIVHPDANISIFEDNSVKGIILSGGPNSVYEKDAPQIDKKIFELHKPVLGVCYGMQLTQHLFGGTIEPAEKREFGKATITIDDSSNLFKDIKKESTVWMSHGDHVSKLADDFVSIAHTDSCIAACKHKSLDIYNLQFHPEVTHSLDGNKIIQNFVELCTDDKSWVIDNLIENKINEIKEIVKNEKVILGLSGGVDSSVAAMLIHKAIGNNLECIFVDTGLMRLNEGNDVMRVYHDNYKMNIRRVNAQDLFFKNLKGIKEPEQKRKIIGKLFVDVFEEEKTKSTGVKYLAQGTIYPDVIESQGVGKHSKTIKSHHNVGGLPENLSFKILEPLRDLFKDEVRKIGIKLGIPEVMINRHPFPGPGLGIRVVEEVTKEKVEILQLADNIFTEELYNENLYDKCSQAFVTLLPCKTVGVMGDNRTYEYVCAIRAVNTVDFMSAEFTKLPYEFLEKVMNRIINEVRGINRVVYDITSKPPGTIEWE